MSNIQNLKKAIKEARKENGATMIEYALVVALIAVIAMAGLRFAGSQVSSQFSSIGSVVGNPS